MEVALRVAGDLTQLGKDKACLRVAAGSVASTPISQIGKLRLRTRQALS